MAFRFLLFSIALILSAAEKWQLLTKELPHDAVVQLTAGHLRWMLDDMWECAIEHERLAGRFENDRPQYWPVLQRLVGGSLLEGELTRVDTDPDDTASG